MMKRPKAYSYIRFSSEVQKLGDSLKRQTHLSQEYVKNNNLILDTSLSMQDLGLSAYSGKNIDDGALGAFLKAINEGKIERGSYLLVESLDRLSRQDVFTALKLFMNILDQGIIIVTLMDGVKYDKESVSKNSTQLIISLTIMQRAYEESETKSRRLKHSWKSKRENAKSKPITTRCPAWLRYDKETDSFIEIPDRVKLLKKFFEWSLKGYGNVSIQARLNGQKVKTWGRSTGWHSSYLQKIFNNRAVLGEFQLHKIKNGKQVKVGDPIKNYYPQVIDEETFYLVQNTRKSRKNKGGRKGKKFKNLFTGLLKCGYCGSSIRFVDKGEGPKGGTYLNCSNGIRNMGCYKTGWQYRFFEKSALKYIENLEIETLFNDNQPSSQIKELENQIVVNEGKLQDAILKSENLIQAIENGISLPNLHKRSAKISSDIDHLEAQSKKIKAKLKHLKSEKETTTSNIENIVEQISLASNVFDENKLHDIRRNLNQSMQLIIGVILLFNVGSPISKEMYEEQVKIFKSQYSKNSKKLISMLDERVETSVNPEERFFSVLFQSGKSQIIRPNFKDPEKIEFIRNSSGEILIDSHLEGSFNLEEAGLSKNDVEELQELFSVFDFPGKK